MGVLNDLEEQKISFSLTYFGKNDLDTSYTIGILIDNYAYFRNLLDKHFSNIGNMDEYILGLINYKIVSLKECIPFIIDEENQKLIKNLVTRIGGKPKKSVGNIIKFINDNMLEILEYNNLDLHKATFNLIKKYQKGIKKSTFEILIEKKRSYFLYNFGDFNTVFKNNVDLLEKLICKNEFYSLDDAGTIIQIINICSMIRNYQGERYFDLANKVINEMYRKYVVLVNSTLNDNRCFKLSDIGKALFVFLKSSKDSRANEIIKINKKLEKNISDYVMKHGIEVKQTIPVEKILKKCISFTNPVLRLLMLTHRKDENGTIKSKLSIAIEDTPNDLMNIITSNIPTDDYYTLIRQQTIESIASIGSALFIGIVQKEDYYTMYFNDFLSLLSLVIKDLHFDSDILEEGKMLVVNISMLIKNVLKKENTQIILQKTLTYNVEMLCCALIESLLREQYRIKNEQVMYINDSNITLGSLLDPNINKEKTFDRDQLLTLAFFLIKSGENKDIGYNYRNNLAHLLHIYKNALSLDKVCLLMYLLTDVLNTVYITSIKYE